MLLVVELWSVTQPAKPVPLYFDQLRTTPPGHEVRARPKLGGIGFTVGDGLAVAIGVALGPGVTPGVGLWLWDGATLGLGLALGLSLAPALGASEGLWL